MTILLLLAGELDRPIQAVRFEEEPLDVAVEWIASAAGIEIVFDPEVHVAEETVTLRLQSVSVRTALRLIMEPRGLTLVSRDGLTVVEPRRDRMVTRRYDVRDLAYAPADFPAPPITLDSENTGIVPPLWPEDSADPPAASLVDLIESQIPDWDAEGADLTVIDGADGLPRFLVVTHSPATHARLADLLSLLRNR